MGLEVPWVAEVQAEPVGSPGFEGFEKKLEVEFSGGGPGLRAISRKNLDRMLKLADCTIVSKLSNEELDSYVLSESSLFVYPLKIVIKTCGTTKLLRSIPILLELATGLGLSVRSCKYRRGTFFFPGEQVYPHGCFSDEVGFLNKFFGGLGSGGGRGFVLGDPGSTRQWHVYVASVDEPSSSPAPPEPTFTLEMCMTGLNRKVAGKFYREVNFTAGEMTRASGIDRLLPDSEICDFAFDPCGYSMNSVEGDAYSTIHVTPEEVCSYASFETMNYGPGKVELKPLVSRVVECFKPGFFSVSVYVSGAPEGTDAGSWAGICCPPGYFCTGSFRQVIGAGDAVVYHTFELKKTGEKWPENSVHPVPLLQAAPVVAASEVKLRLVRNPEFSEFVAEMKMVQLVSCLSCAFDSWEGAWKCNNPNPFLK